MAVKADHSTHDELLEQVCEDEIVDRINALRGCEDEIDVFLADDDPALTYRLLYRCLPLEAKPST